MCIRTLIVFNWDWTYYLQILVNMKLTILVSVLFYDILTRPVELGLLEEWQLSNLSYLNLQNLLFSVTLGCNIKSFNTLNYIKKMKLLTQPIALNWTHHEKYELAIRKTHHVSNLFFCISIVKTRVHGVKIMNFFCPYVNHD